MQIHARRKQIRVPSRGLHFGKRPATGQRVANECVAAVVNGQRAESIPAQYAAGGVETVNQPVAVSDARN